MLPDGKGSYHSFDVATVPKSTKDVRSRVVHLDNDGNVVSLFRPQDREAYTRYLPIKAGKMITIGAGSTEYEPYIFSLFNSEGKRLWHKQIEHGFSYNHTTQYKEDVSFVQQSWYQETAETLITTIDKDLKLSERKISLKNLKVPGHRLRVHNTLQTGKDTYLLAAQIYDADKSSVVTLLYTKLVLVSQGNIQWSKSLENIIVDIRYLVKVDNGFLIVGHDSNSLPLVIIFDINGNIIKRFAPDCASRGVFTRYYYTGKSLMILDQKARGISMFISSYDLSGKLQWNKSIPINYSIFRDASILGADEDSFLVNGSFANEFAGPTHAFIMKFLFKDMMTDTLDDTHVIRKIFSEDIIANVDQIVTFVKVYPNPTQFQLTFQIDKTDDHTEYVLSLFDQNGKEVLHRKNTGSRFFEDISHLAPAIYIYNIHAPDGKKIISGQMVKQ